MNSHLPRSHHRAKGAASAVLAAVLGLGFAACAPSTDSNASADSSTPASGDAVPHGHIEGAEEVSEAQTGLAYIQNGGNSLSILDLASEETATVPLEIDAATIVEDSRFVYLTDGARTLEVIDTGVWTIDHVDHVHYYRAPAESVGTLEFDHPIVSIIGNGPITTVGTSSGTVVLLDRQALENGEIHEIGTLQSDAESAFAVPYRDHLLLSTSTGMTYVNQEGELVAEVDSECASPNGWAIQRSGIAVGCDDGVFLAKSKGDEIHSLTLAYEGSTQRANEFFSRPRSNEAATLAGSEGAWNVNVSKEILTFIPVAGGAVAANSPANEEYVLNLDGAGVLRTSALLNGETIAEAAILPAGATTVIALDSYRAYLVDASSQTAYEVDYADSLRIARTFTLDQRPDLLVEVGR